MSTWRRSNYHSRMALYSRGRIPLGNGTGITRGESVVIVLDDQAVTAQVGETVAAVIVAQEGLATRTTVGGERRGIYCGMGVCFDCLIVVDGIPNTRACLTLVADGMRVDRQVGAGKADSPY
jgi:predicted molibdopterin-dependent oxidoreductase YjgC